MPQLRFRLNIPAEEYRAYYAGTAKDVVTTSFSGQTVQFPANILRPFLTHNGIQGEFILFVDDNNKVETIKKLT